MVIFPSLAAAQPRNEWPSTVDQNWTAPGTTPIPPPNATLGAPTFDAFATGSQQMAPVASTQPYPGAPQPYSAAPQQYPPGQFPGSPLPNTQLYNGTEPYPSQAPPAVFSNGIWQAPPPTVGVQGPTMRFLQAPRIRHSWLYGSKGDQLQINDIDMSLAFAFPNFFGSTQPLYVVPSFSLHLWDGPDVVPPGSSADLPGSAYSGFLDTGWESDPAMTWGGELGARIGVFTGFDTFVDNSWRLQGKALLRVRLTPTAQLRGGVYYADRIRVGVLPVGGVLWTPNPQTRFDIYFPSPKLSQYMTTVGNNELWWYLAAEYGGGSWTIKRAVNNLTEQIDINDIRVSLGVEFGPSRLFKRGRRVGFFEVAWVTDREILYQDRPQDNLKLDDTIMLRTGFGY